MYRIFFIFLTAGIIFISGCANKKNNADSGKIDTASVKKTATNTLSSTEFYFVGTIGENPGIYKFFTKSQPSGKWEKNSSKFWTKHNEKVVKLSYSPDKKSLFFITASDFGKKAIFPFINNIKLYRISPDSSKVKFIKKIGNGLQVFTLWGQDKTFRIILNTFDRNSADFVNQQTFIFNEAGKLVNVSSKKFNIAKEGYPQLIEKTGITSSPGSRYSIFAVDSTQTSIYLQSNSDGKAELITAVSQKLNQADWSADEKYLIFSTVNASRKNKANSDGNSKIFVYSIEKKKIIKTMDAAGIKNFFVIGDLLIFDKGFEKNSFIETLNYKTLQPFYSIHLQGGCGLKNIL